MPATYYWLGDVPAVPLALVPAREGELIDLTAYTGATAALAKPSGVTVANLTVTLGSEDVEVQLPALDVAGLSWLRVTLQAAGGRSNRLDAVPIIVMDDSDGWHTLPSARDEWQDAKSLSDRRLYTLLQVAKVECLAYAPALPDGALPPINYREAQLMHARNRLNASLVGPAGSSGSEDFTLTPYPLDWTTKQLLRPQTGFKAAR